MVFCISRGIVWKNDDQGFGSLNPLLNNMIENNFFTSRQGGLNSLAMSVVNDYILTTY
jgi:hypothetical protein